ncbi:unnamed protein product, partial [Cuscuta campestris]
MASLLNSFQSMTLSNIKYNPVRTPHLSCQISPSPPRRRLLVRAIETDSQVEAKVPDKAPSASGSGINQILGIKGAKQEK